MAVGVRCADHATPIRKIWHYLRCQAAAAGWYRGLRSRNLFFVCLFVCSTL
jgi:hypothetical protein